MVPHVQDVPLKDHMVWSGPGQAWEKPVRPEIPVTHLAN